MARIFTVNGSGFDFFSWNIESNVGLRSPNKKTDVELVQFGYFAFAAGSKGNPKLKPFAAKVVPGASYTGAPDDPLTVAIIQHQKIRGGTQDGHVSPMHGKTQFYGASDGPHSFMLTILVNNMRALMGPDFPRIDRHPKCPLGLRASIRAAFETGAGD